MSSVPPSVGLSVSNTTVLSMGVAGIPMKEFLSEPTKLIIEGQSVNDETLKVSKTTPLPSLGRQTLCKLGATIYCTKEGMYMELPPNNIHQFFNGIKKEKREDNKEKAALYCWQLIGNFYSPLIHEVIQNLKAKIDSNTEELMYIILTSFEAVQLHCTAWYIRQKAETYQCLVQSFLNREEIVEATPRIYFGPEELGVAIDLTPLQQQRFREANSTPHLTLAVKPPAKPKDMGPMIVGIEREKQQHGYQPWAVIKLQNVQIDFITHNRGILQWKGKNHASTFEKQQPPEQPSPKLPMALNQVSSELWAKHKNHVGQVHSAVPHRVQLIKNAVLPSIRQYRLPPEAENGIEPVISALLEQGVLEKTQSPCNTPILPIPKVNRPNEWRFVQDLRAINKIVVAITPVVPDTNIILSAIPPTATVFTVIDLCSVFFSIPLNQESQYLFAFTHKKQQYTWTRLPQGYTESPAVYAAAVKRDLEDCSLSDQSVLLQYADDFLVASSHGYRCMQDSLELLQHLCERGHRVSLQKLQFCQTQVQYLGFHISQGQSQLGPERIQTIENGMRS
uniref:uncharacterized protein n=1 Tax=Pristiophorus japonicus TaxID=55135 RepID=UPI00398ECE3E